MTVIRLCQDEHGYLWATAQPDNNTDCESGPVLGPPEGLRKDVHNRLVMAKIYNAFDLINNRKVLLDILNELRIDRSYARTVIHLYQEQYYKKEDE